MRRWVVAACCTMLLLGGCNNSADGESQKNQNEPSLEALNPLGQANLLVDGQNTNGEEIGTEILPVGPELVKDVTIRQSDGTSLHAQSSAIANETIGYYLYILPGYSSKINPDSGTLAITRENGTEVIIEALPPQADAQLAADELWRVLQQIDEDARQLTEYSRYEEWEDAYIYRAYRNDTRLTAMIKKVDDIVFRITISEPADIDELRMIMAMIASIDTDDIQLFTQADETFVLSLLTEAYRMQLTVMDHFGISSASESESGDSTGDVPLDDAPGLPDGTPEVAVIPLSEMIGSRDDVLAMFSYFYTYDAAESVADMLKIVEYGGVVGSSATIEGTKLLWDQAKINVISDNDTRKRYLLRVPFDLEGTFKLYEIELRKQAEGWRINTPLKTHDDVPDVPEA